MSTRNFHVMSSDLVLSQLLNRIETAVTLFTGIRTFVLGQKEPEERTFDGTTTYREGKLTRSLHMCRDSTSSSFARASSVRCVCAFGATFEATC